MSQFLRLNVSDFLKGILIATLAAFFAAIYQIVSTGALPTVEQLRAAGLTALAAGLSYLTKNLFSNSQGQVGTEPK